MLAAINNHAWADEPKDQANDKDAKRADEVIVVKGKHLKPLDLTANSPVVLVSDEEFKLSGRSTVEHVLNQLPQVVPGASSQTNNPGAGFATIDLRGLGHQRTLVLVNGRRWIPADNSGGFGGTDMNTIPSGTIGRVEVITGGASSRYGADAVAGVINFITRSRFEGVELNGRVSMFDEGDGESYNLTAFAGSKFLDGRGTANIYGGYFKRTQLLGEDRPQTSVRCDDGPGDLASRGPYPCGPAGGDGRDVLHQGGSGYIPEGRIWGGFTVPGSGRVANILFEPEGSVRAWNSVTDLYNFAPAQNIRVPMERYSTATDMGYRLTDNVMVQLEATYVNVQSLMELAPTPYAEPLTLSVDLNPFLTEETKAIFRTSGGYNPTNGDFSGWAIRRMLESGSRKMTFDTNAYRVVSGFLGKIGNGGGWFKNWAWDLYYLFARTDLSVTQTGNVRPSRIRQGLLLTSDSDGNVTCRDPSNGCIPLNIFGAGKLTPDMVDFIKVDTWGEGRTETRSFAGTISGNLPGLPAGPVEVSAGFEYRKEHGEFDVDPVSASGDIRGFFAPGDPLDGGYDVFDLFLDTRIPVLIGRTPGRFVALDLGVRVSDYSTVGRTLTFKAGGEFGISEAVRIRGLFQRAKRPPNVAELFGPQRTSTTNAIDFCDQAQRPVTNGLSALCVDMGVPATHFDADALGQNPEGTFVQAAPQIEVLTGGNPDLDEETSNTWTIGAVIQPEILDGLAVTVDWYGITVHDAIATAGGGAISVLNFCSLSRDANSQFCRLIPRAADGTITQIRVLNDNLSSFKTRGLDVSVSYGFELDSLGLEGWGNLNFFGTVGRVDRWSLTPSKFVPQTECAGKFAAYGSTCGLTLSGFPTPDLRSRLRTTWKKGPVQLSANWRWIGGLEDLNPNAAIRKVEGRHYLDLTASWKAHKSTTLRLGASNVTNVEPPLVGSSQTGSNTLVPLFDALGTRIFFSATTRF